MLTRDDYQAASYGDAFVSAALTACSFGLDGLVGLIVALLAAVFMQHALQHARQVDRMDKKV